MVKVLPFQGYTSNPQLASELISRPYDVVTRSQAHQLSNQKPHSYYHVIRPEISLPATVDEHDTSVYELGKNNLHKFIEQGYLIQDNESRVYVYETVFSGFKSVGFMVLFSLQEYENNIVKRHELTRKDKEQDRTHLIDIQSSNSEPILAGYRDTQDLDEILIQATAQQPYIDTVTVDDQATHRLWKLSAETSQLVAQKFGDVDSIYIADGHHRVAASLNVAKLRREQLKSQGVQLTGLEPFEFTLAFVVPSKCLHICGYHRVIKSLNGVPVENVLHQLSQVFDIAPIEQGKEPTSRGQFSFNVDKKWLTLSFKKEVLDSYLIYHNTPAERLDVQILQDLVITKIFGIGDIRTDPNIEFVGGTDGIKGLQDKVDAGNAVAIACFPVSTQDVFDIADQNQIMMPKSTWVVPKPRSGLVMRTFE